MRILYIRLPTPLKNHDKCEKTQALILLERINVAPCKVIRIPESGNFFPVESGLLGFGIWNSAKGSRILLPIGIGNPCSSDKESRIQYLESEIYSVESLIILHRANQQAAFSLDRQYGHPRD